MAEEPTTNYLDQRLNHLNDFQPADRRWHLKKKIVMTVRRSATYQDNASEIYCFFNMHKILNLLLVLQSYLLAVFIATNMIVSLSAGIQHGLLQIMQHETTGTRFTRNLLNLQSGN